MICQSCGNEIADTLIFCTKCGARQGAATAPPPQKPQAPAAPQAPPAAQAPQPQRPAPPASTPPRPAAAPPPPQAAPAPQKAQTTPAAQQPAQKQTESPDEKGPAVAGFFQTRKKAVIIAICVLVAIGLVLGIGKLTGKLFVKEIAVWEYVHPEYEEGTAVMFPDLKSSFTIYSNHTGEAVIKHKSLAPDKPGNPPGRHTCKFTWEEIDIEDFEMGYKFTKSEKHEGLFCLILLDKPYSLCKDSAGDWWGKGGDIIMTDTDTGEKQTLEAEWDQTWKKVK